MNIGDCMKRKVISSRENITIREAAGIMVQYHIGTLPIVDNENHLVSVANLRNLLVPAIPDFFKLVADLDFVHDFGAAEYEKPDQDFLNASVSLIAEVPVYVEESAGLVRAITMLQEHVLYDLPVVDDEMHLVGIASQVDIGIALINNWDSTL